jgi:hypothetical protein
MFHEHLSNDDLMKLNFIDTRSLIFYVTVLLTFVWRTGPRGETTITSNPLIRAEWVACMVFSGVLIVGLLYLFLILGTLRRYGGEMDKEWRETIREAVVASDSNIARSFMASRPRVSHFDERTGEPFVEPPFMTQANTIHASPGQLPCEPIPSEPPASVNQPPVTERAPNGAILHAAMKVLNFRRHQGDDPNLKQFLTSRGIDLMEWDAFILVPFPSSFAIFNPEISILGRSKPVERDQKL